MILLFVPVRDIGRLLRFVLCIVFMQTIFEINSTNRTQAFAVMKQKRSHDELVIERKQRGLHQRSHTMQSTASDVADVAVAASDNDVQVTLTVQ